VRKFPPRSPGRVVGVASETGLIAFTTADDGPSLLFRVLEHLDQRQVSGKQLLFQDWPARGGSGSLVLSLENLHDFPALRRDVEAAFAGRVQFRDGLGAVSVIGAGINATFHNVRRAFEVLSGQGATVLGVSTSSFRISFLLEEAMVPEAVRGMHAELVTEGDVVE
jgi:aspartate kinase